MLHGEVLQKYILHVNEHNAGKRITTGKMCFRTRVFAIIFNVPEPNQTDMCLKTEKTNLKQVSYNDSPLMID
jgi:hypothetical protein